MRQKFFLTLLCLALILTGCSGKEAYTVQTVPGMTEGMEKEAVIEYVVPKSVPGILINQAGYHTESSKTAIFRGENLPETFCVYNAENGMKVYEGTVEKKGNDAVTGEQIAYGTFSDVKMPGEYYIEADIVGRSYTFSVGNQVYRELLHTNLQHFYAGLQGKTTLTEEEIKENSKALMNLLLACELHGTGFSDEMGIPESGNGIPDIIDVLLIQVTLLMNQSETVMASDDWELVAYYAAAMAKFSYTYKEYDSKFATSSLQLADMVWKYMEQNAKNMSEDRRFMVAAELYRSSGGQSYHTYIKQYGAKAERKLNSREAIYGAITYVSTKQSVDIQICSAFMKTIMTEAEEIAAISGESFYQVRMEEKQDNQETIFWNMIILTVVDKVISNHEYATIIENHLHYLLGRNPWAVSFMDGEGDYSCTEEGMKSVLDGGFEETALLFMLSEINERMP